jgi:hypothetical protein
MEGKTIVVWFSCGAASAVAAKMVVDQYGKDNTIRIVNNPIKEEHPDNQRFLWDVQMWLDHKIEFALSSEYPSASCQDVWDKRKYMSGPGGAPCTMILKKRARQEWEERNPHDYMVLGFTAEEKKRHDRFVMTERDNLLPVLIENGITKPMCYEIIERAGIALPDVYGLGYPNANCIGCVKSTSVTYWNHVRKTNPDVFAARVETSRRIGARLVIYKGKRIFLDELPPDAKGRPMKTIADFECGIFCEEKM